MSLVSKLVGFGFRQVIGAEAGNEASEIAGNVAGLVQKHFTDHSQTLSKALARANDRAWQALSIALAGDTFLDKIKVFFAAGDDQGIREQVRLFLQDKNIGFEGTPADLRKRCLTELNLAKKAGLLSAQNLSAQEVARQTANFRRYADPKAMVDGAENVMRQIAADLNAEYPNLAKLLRQRPAGGPPLLVAAFAYFFRREVEADDELAHGLFFDGLRQLSASQEKAFAEVGKVLTTLGQNFEQVFDQLARIEEVVLDLQAEFQRVCGLHLANAEELRRLMLDVLNRVSQIGMQKGEVKPHHSFSIRSEDERDAVKQLLARFRQLPAEQQRQVPALLNGLGKLQFGSQDFDGARQTFVAVAEKVHDTAAQAEAQFNAYRAALEEKKWDDALAAIQQATSLDPQRFSPFPLQRYQPKKILGAGGFGTAFLCHDRFFNTEVVVKTLHDAAMERNMTDVFREAQVLGQLHHPAIIGVRDCNYADITKMARPYIVMDYFPGGSLQKFVQERGAISADEIISVARQIAQGMLAAHQSRILHRDLKPDNVLVRKEGDKWKVKIIDFGLALRKQTIETSMTAGAAGNTILGDSVAGTIEYAPPEQMGKLKGVKPGPYSDVYAFGKMCCYALFKTTEAKNRHWVTISKELAGMLEQCTEQELEHRLSSFEPVLKVLDGLDPHWNSTRKTRRNEGKDVDDEDFDEDFEDKPAEDKNFEDEDLEDEPAEDENGKDDAPDESKCRMQDRLLTSLPKSERKPGEIVTNSLGMKFAWIPPGTFLMGSPANEEKRSNDETQHKVTLTKGFFMGVHLVTQEQWQSVMGTNPSNFKGEKNLPVERVSWNECQEFINQLRLKDQRPYRLPTEAEWEYACRAGTTTPFWFGETISSDQANYDGSYIYCREKTTPVGSFPANAWGLHDMHGNLWQWCHDWFGDYPQNDITNPQGADSGQYRVLRGGSWVSNPENCRSARRLSYEPGSGRNNYGFRLCFFPDEIFESRPRLELGQQDLEQQRKELEKLQQAGKAKLIHFIREAMDRTQGEPTQDDTAAATEIVKQHHLSSERAKQIVEEVREQWQKAHPPRTERKPGEIITNSLGMKFAWIPAGTFLMGSPANEEGRSGDENQHRVTLTKGFYMGVHLVTQEQWQSVMGNNPSSFKGDKSLPVDNVSWNDCQGFMKQLRLKDQRPYRLPTEAEWEYACRAGTTTPFWFGETISTDQANYNGDHIYGSGEKGIHRQKTTPVGMFPANAWGLHDMHGNLWEWCQDWFGHYPQNDVTDPQGADSGQYRVLRGGSWLDDPDVCRSAGPYWNEPGARSNSYGFRLCFYLD